MHLDNAKPSLFVVDDDPDQAYLIELAAERTGAFGGVYVVTEPERALSQLVTSARDERFRPGLIVLDWKMPRINGSELLEAVKSQPELKDVPVVILSSSDYVKDREQALSHGCTDFVQKPAGFRDFVTLLRELRAHWCPTSPLSVETSQPTAAAS